MPTHLIPLDYFYLQQALDQAKVFRGFCAPNPSVGAVIVDDNGNLLATGHHRGSGLPHAEVEALTKLNRTANGATIYITLEPCDHWGKTPPCTQALIRSGIKRVVYAHQDPNPITSGKAARVFQEAGIAYDHVLVPEIEEFYLSYDYWHQTKRPLVTAKIAMSLDGNMAGQDGAPVQITGKKLSELTHYSRLHHDAILTTAKTVLCDNPQLNARYQNQIVAKPIYVLDCTLKVPAQATIFKTAKSVTLFYDHSIQSNKTLKFFNELNIKCVPIACDAGRLDLFQVLDYLGNEGIHDLWVEAGGTCFSALVELKLIQKAFIYLAPRWLGVGQKAFSDKFSFGDAKHFRWQQYDNDVLCEIAW